MHSSKDLEIALSLQSSCMACPVGGTLVNFSKRYLMDVETSLA